MTTPATPAADAVSLHDLIMNLPTLADHVIEEGYQFTSTRIAYKSGHRDARHAAAKLAAARESSLAQQHALELLSLNGQAMERESALVAERDALRAALGSIAAFATGEGDVCEIIAKRARAALAAPAVEG